MMGSLHVLCFLYFPLLFYCPFAHSRYTLVHNYYFIQLSCFDPLCLHIKLWITCTFGSMVCFLCFCGKETVSFYLLPMEGYPVYEWASLFFTCGCRSAIIQTCLSDATWCHLSRWLYPVPLSLVSSITTFITATHTDTGLCVGLMLHTHTPVISST